MTEVEIGGQAVRLHGSARAPLTWYEAFHDDGLYDALLAVATYRGPGGRPRMPMRDILRTAWVLAHDAQAAAGEEPQGFREWVAAHPDLDFTALRGAVTKEAMASFFPSVAAAAAAQGAAGPGGEGAAEGGDAGVRQEDGA